MSLQKLHFSLHENGKMHISKQLLLRPRRQQNQFQLPAIVNSPARLSIRDKLLLLIGVFFGIVYLLSAIVSMQLAAQQAIADQKAQTLATTFSTPFDPIPTPRTTILNPPPVTMGKQSLTPTLTPAPTARPTPATFNPGPTPCPGLNCNPWDYNFIPGNLIYNPPADFCNYFACTPNFYKPHHLYNSYIVECNDGMYSQSNGGPGTCGHHGGVLRPLYAH